MPEESPAANGEVILAEGEDVNSDDALEQIFEMNPNQIDAFLNPLGWILDTIDTVGGDSMTIETVGEENLTIETA